jgi:hypothetical protein
VRFDSTLIAVAMTSVQSARINLIPLPEGRMLHAGLMRFFGCTQILLLLMGLGVPAALAQNVPDIAALNARVERLYGQGNWAEATTLAEQTLALAERARGAEHPDTLLSVSNLSLLYMAQSHYSEAEPLMVRVLTTSEKLLGSDHPDVASLLNNLAALYKSLTRKFLSPENRL